MAQLVDDDDRQEAQPEARHKVKPAEDQGAQWEGPVDPHRHTAVSKKREVASGEHGVFTLGLQRRARNGWSRRMEQDTSTANLPARRFRIELCRPRGVSETRPKRNGQYQRVGVEFPTQRERRRGSASPFKYSNIADELLAPGQRLIMSGEDLGRKTKTHEPMNGGDDTSSGFRIGNVRDTV